MDSGAELFRWTLKRTRALSGPQAERAGLGGDGGICHAVPITTRCPILTEHSLQEVLLLLLWVSGEKREVLECRQEVGRRHRLCKHGCCFQQKSLSPAGSCS